MTPPPAPGPAPLLAAEPTRFAAFGRDRARGALLLLALLLAACLLALGAPTAEPRTGTGPDDARDVELYQTIVESVRHGGDYYTVAAEELRAGGYPMKPFVTMRMPTLAAVLSRVPETGAAAMLYALAAAVALAWWMRIAPAFRRPLARAAAMLLLAAGMAAFLQRDLLWFHEIWAGLLIALSLALRRPGRWVEAAAFGLAATLVRETAALYVGVMSVLAWMEGDRREALGWAAAVGVFAVAVAAHAFAVAQVVRPLDAASPGWAGMLGPGFFAATMARSTALTALPLWAGAALVGLALFGWAAWRGPLARRALATFAAYAVLLGVAGRADTFYWGLMIAPALLVGLAFAPDGLRDLLRAAAGRRRRITVTRVAR